MKILDNILRAKIFKTSLRFKVAVAFVLPMILVLVTSSYVQNTREQAELEKQIEASTIQLGDVTLGNLRHAMLLNDKGMVGGMLQSIKKGSTFENIWILDVDSRIAESTNLPDIGTTLRTDRAGCVECHNRPTADRPRIVELHTNGDVLRVVTPIRNELECQACHSAENTNLGVLIIDAPLAEIEEHLRKGQIYDLALSLIAILVMIALAYTMIQWLVVKRVGVLYKSLSAFAGGDFSARVPKTWRTEDEITRLADHFNEIADALARHEKEQRQITIIRQEAVHEERERIARDLHDGLAQLLAYLSAKISATRLLLQQNRTQVADDQLAQMEDAVQKETNEVRAAIIGLKLMGKDSASLFENLTDYVNTSNRLGDLRILFEHGPDVEGARVSPDAEIHLLRITQEAIHNIRKHAIASFARIGLRKEADLLILTIEDDGVGFDTGQSSVWHQPHLGLRTMGERAELIGAAFKVESVPGQGTRVSVRLKIKES
jgi:signal transduction histidine kinase